MNKENLCSRCKNKCKQPDFIIVVGCKNFVQKNTPKKKTTKVNKERKDKNE